MQRKTLRTIVQKLFAILSRVEIHGLESVPLSGGYILAVNHLGRLDAPLVFALVDREDCTGLVTDKYKTNPFFAWLVKIVKGIWIHREDADIHALREARAFLQAGGMLGIAPEGTRSQTGALAFAKTGVAYLADKAGVGVIPVAITGTERVLHDLLRLRRARLSISFGPVLQFPAVSRQGREAALQSNTDEIMCQIAAMLPDAYRGVYASHPRLDELLGRQPASSQAGVQPVY